MKTYVESVFGEDDKHTLQRSAPAHLALLRLREQVLRERERPAPLRPEAVLARLVTKSATQKRTQTRQAYDPHFCLSSVATNQERTYIEPFWIPLTLKEKRHYEVCLERVFTRLAGVGLEQLGEEARHRRLVVVFLRHNT